MSPGHEAYGEATPEEQHPDAATDRILGEKLR